MSNDTKIWLAMFGLVALLLVGFGVLIWQENTHKAELQKIACVNPDSVACALAVRK